MAATAASMTPDQAQQYIYDFLRTNYGLPDAISKLIVAQSGHETAGWTSNIYQTYNNAFGYGVDGSGSVTGYNSVDESIEDVVNWLSSHIPNFQAITDPDIYAQALQSAGYYTDAESNYAQGIWDYLNNNLQLVAGVSVAAVVGIGLLVYILFFSKKGL
jgi:flagellum-specific peptidoglycan hydrolase FlgJ